MRSLIFFILISVSSSFASERDPQTLINQLLDHYGKKFGGSYVEALAVVVRARELGADAAKPVVAGQLSSPADLKSGSQVAGRLIFAELSAENPKAKQLTLEAANLGFAKDGKPLEAMPFHNEMSDAVFMSCPILAEAGALTGESRYFDQCVKHLQFIQGKCLRKDGIYRHSPLDESAWGRGNGFPAIGLAMVLEEMPEDYPRRDFVVSSFRDHLTALKKFQDSDGMWHQVIDHPQSYPEFTCTCMISYAALVGIRLGILEKNQWDDVLKKSWKAIDARISPDGREVRGACTGTGKQKSLEAYLTRKEINGYDDRSGSMALLFASEMKRYLAP
ncbi:MAG: glycoside hydrolase family 88 protein [Verrucomicrobiales bacterium]|nr:glycoside hydrolase family 88 protein [Verrucomicrobiales bacterium]